MGERWLVRSLLERERRSAVDSMSEAQQHELAQRDAALREAEYARAIAEKRMANLATHSKAAASYQSLCHQLDVATARSHELERSMRDLREASERQLEQQQRVIDDLHMELSRLQTSSTRQKVGLSWRVHTGVARRSLLSQALMMEREAAAHATHELKRIQEMRALERKQTIKALNRLHVLEVEQMRRAQEAEARNFAAKMLQRYMRRRRAKAEEHERQANVRADDIARLASVQVDAAKTAADVDRTTSKFRGMTMTVRDARGVEITLKDALVQMINSPAARAERGRVEALLAQHRGDAAEDAAAAVDDSGKYLRELRLGQPEAAALGIVSALKVDLLELFALCQKGVDAIRQEWEASGTDEDLECVDYVLNQPAGKSSKEFLNGVRDVGRNGERLEDFARKPEAVTAELTLAHVAALRLYTTACFKGINVPLRDPERTTPHPYPATVFFLADGIKRLRASHSAGQEQPGGAAGVTSGISGSSTRGNKRCPGGGGGGDGAGGGDEVLNLYRGMKDVTASADFERDGGSEPALMSTTSDPSVAVAYGQSKNSLLFKIVSRSIMTRGADITFLSAFPGEREFLFPPLTFLQPTGRPREVFRLQLQDAQGKPTKEHATFTVVEVEPVLA